MFNANLRVVLVVSMLLCLLVTANSLAVDGSETGSHDFDKDPPIASSQDAVYSLDNLVAIGLKSNPGLEAVRQRIVQKKGQVTQVRANYLPNLSLTGKYSYSEREDSDSSDIIQNNSGRNLETVEGGDSTGGDDREKGDVLEGTVSLSQLIYDFGKTEGAIDVELAQLQAVDSQMKRQIQDLVFRVKEAYYNVLEKQRLIEVAQEAVKSFEQHLNRASLYLKAGVRTKIDVINAEVELSNAHMTLLRAQYDLKIAKVELEQILGTKPNRGKYILQQDEIQLDSLLDSMPPLPENLETLINSAMENRPDLFELKKLLQGAEERLKSVRGDYWPAITAEASYTDYETDITQYEDSWDVGIAARWELFSGFRTRGEAAEALGSMLENRANLEELELAVEREVTESFLRAGENRQGVAIALKTLELAKENVILAEKRYKTGTNDVLEFNDAQLRLTSTRSDLVVAYFTYLTALASIEYAVGEVFLDDLLQH